MVSALRHDGSLMRPQTNGLLRARAGHRRPADLLDEPCSGTEMTPSLTTRVCDFLSAFLAKFFKDGLPVALAGAIGALVVGQINRPAPIVVQAPPAAVPQPGPVVPERVVEELKRDAEPRPVTAQAVAKSAPVERKSRPAAPEKAAKPQHIPDKKAIAAEPLPAPVLPPVALAA